MFTSQLFGNIKCQCASNITVFISKETRNYIHANVLLIINYSHHNTINDPNVLSHILCSYIFLPQS